METREEQRTPAMPAGAPAAVAANGARRETRAGKRAARDATRGEKHRAARAVERVEPHAHANGTRRAAARRAAHAPPGPGRQCVSARVRSTRDAPTGHACDATRRSRECSGKCGVPGSRTAGAEAARPDRARGGRESGAARERRREPRARPRERQTGIVFFRPDEIRRERKETRQETREREKKPLGSKKTKCAQKVEYAHSEDPEIAGHATHTA